MKLQMKHAERAHADTEYELLKARLIAEGMPAYFFTLDYETDTVTLSPALMKKVPFPGETLFPSRKFTEFVHPEDVQKVCAALSLFSRGKTDNCLCEFRLRALGGGYIWVLASGRGARDARGRPRLFCGAIQDISEQVRTKLINDMILDGTSGVVYVFDAQRNEVRFSPKMAELVSMGNLHLKPALEAWIAHIVPEDRAHFIESMQAFIYEKCPLHAVEYRMIGRDNKPVWVACRGKGVHDKDGNPLMLTGFIMSIEEMDKYNQFLERKSFTDRLTGLPNRLSLYNDVRNMLQQCESAALLLVDIRNLKAINDLYGHATGDMFLAELAAQLRLFLPGSASLYKFNRDQYVVTLPFQDAALIDQYVATCLKQSEQPLTVDGKRISYHLGYGVARYPEDGRELDELLTAADLAKSKARQNQQEGYAFASAADREEYLRQLELEMQLRLSIENDFRGFQLCYQPIVKPGTPLCTGAEALLRWYTPEGEEVSPTTIIPILEDADLIGAVGMWVLSQAVRQTRRWIDAGCSPNFNCNVNLSPKQLQDNELPQKVHEILRQEGLSPKNLSLEITESSIMGNIQQGIAILNELRRQGVRIALDDFGTGYSSLSYLRSLPVDEIKIDRSFLSDIGDAGFNQSFITAIVDLAHSIQHEICAEGVEEHAQMKTLIGMKVDKLQGYYFSKPCPPEVFESTCLRQYFLPDSDETQ